MLQSSREGYSESNLNQRSGPNFNKMETKFLPIFNIWVLFRRSTTANSVVESPI